MRLVVLGLSITSSWGNGHATTYRALLREFTRRGHDVLFLEHDKPWYGGEHRDLPDPPMCDLRLYDSIEELQGAYADEVAAADAVIVGSYVPRGVEVGDWAIRTASGPVAFYDIDTPVTLAKLRRGDFEYLTPELIGRYDAYLSFSAGPTRDRLEREYGSPMARALHCSVDPEHYYPTGDDPDTDLGYLGTYSDDRQPTLSRLLIEPARRWDAGRFVVAGPQYPGDIDWPGNVRRIEHCPPADHRDFYNRCRWTLNVTRADMIAAGWSPSVRLFEAAACGTAILSDDWPGLGDYFPLGEAICVADSAGEALNIMQDNTARRSVAAEARRIVLEKHTAVTRAAELETFLAEAGANAETVVPA